MSCIENLLKLFRYTYHYRVFSYLFAVQLHYQIIQKILALLLKLEHLASRDVTCMASNDMDMNCRDTGIH